MKGRDEAEDRCDPGILAMIVALLDDSAAGWNTADLPRFMASYAERDDVLYVTRNQLVTGRAAIEAIYRDRFANPAEMGEYIPRIVACRQLGDDHIHAVSRFRLMRSEQFGGDVEGFASLLFARTGDSWRIVADHV